MSERISGFLFLLVGIGMVYYVRALLLRVNTVSMIGSASFFHILRVCESRVHQWLISGSDYRPDIKWVVGLEPACRDSIKDESPEADTGASSCIFIYGIVNESINPI